MTTIRSLLAATDFSVDAHNAVARAAFVAAEHRVELALLHVVSGPSFKILRVLFRPSVEVEAKLIEEAQHTLSELAAEIAAEFHITAMHHVEVGVVLEEILTAAQRADIVFLGARGLNPMRDVLLGTTADRLLRKCRRPMLVTKRAPQDAYRRVLVPVDFSPYSAGVLKAAIRIAPLAEINVFHAFVVPFEEKLRWADVSNDQIDRYRAQARRKALANMNSLIDRVAGDSQPFHRTLARGDAPRLICKREAKISADLIVIGKRGQSLIEELFLGGVTRHILSQAKCDVLIVSDKA